MSTQEDVAEHALAGRGAPAGLVAGVRRAAFGLIALVILLGPAPGQLFGVHTPLLREWVMYSGVGIGMLRGRFVVTEGGQEVASLTPLEALGLPRYPQIRHYFFEHRVRTPADLAGHAAGLCVEGAPERRVAFDGDVATRQGWKPMPVPDVCAAIAPEAVQ